MQTRLLLAGLSTLAVSGASLALPWTVKYFVNSTLSQGGTALAALSLALAVLFLIIGICHAAENYLLESVAQQFANDLMIDLYSNVQRLPVSFFDKQRVGEIMSHVVNDITFIRNSVSGGLLQAITLAFTTSGAAVLIFVIDWQLGLIVLAAAPLIAFVGGQYGKLAREATGKTLERMASVTATMQQNLSGIRVVKSFVREDYESRRFTSQVNDLYAAIMRQAKIVAVLQPIITGVVVLTIVGVLYYGARRVTSGALSLGDLTALLLYVFMLSGPTRGLTGLYAELQEALAASKRVFSLLDTKSEVNDAPDAVELQQVKGRIEFRDVSFSYEAGKEVLKGLQLSVEPGEAVALVGPSGAGKTTLASLLLRFYDVNAGAVLIDGLDLREIKSSSLRSHIGLVAQDVLLFSSTIRENIRYGRLSATDEEVEAAARAANAHDFILSFRKGYDTLVGERGVTLSGGQRQRITIARTLLSDPSILVLDEATSDLDTESEYLVREAIAHLMVDRTALIIDHRLSTVVEADRIIVLEAGEVVAQGTHEELMRSSELYQRLYVQQFQGAYVTNEE
jgi:subfamily B ATP-binding cassette protein MsbA